MSVSAECLRLVVQASEVESSHYPTARVTKFVPLTVCKEDLYEGVSLYNVSHLVSGLVSILTVIV